MALSRATLDGWVMQVGESLQPLAAEMRRKLLRGGCLQVDETPVPVQEPAKKRRHHQACLWACLWQYGRPGADAGFDFQMGRDRAGPRTWLEQWSGVLQTGGYAAHEGVGGAGIVHAGCRARVRRKFHDAVRLNEKDRAALSVLARLGELFAMDARARDLGHDHARRHAAPSAPGSRRRDPLRCPARCWPRRPATPWRSGRNSPASWRIPHWS